MDLTTLAAQLPLVAVRGMAYRSQDVVGAAVAVNFEKRIEENDSEYFRFQTRYLMSPALESGSNERTVVEAVVRPQLLLSDFCC